ncbi:hypothetical protein [Paraburkholderia sp. BL10I2N1]|nr:hypothetical protein [Paraburkholderia sp. BL10I2N1]TDN67334.1 hypothetical protein B0G77_0595 [Paraburkholderia sp. BL10I2N1]
MRLDLLQNLHQPGELDETDMSEAAAILAMSPIEKIEGLEDL